MTSWFNGEKENGQFKTPIEIFSSLFLCQETLKKKTTTKILLLLLLPSGKLVDEFLDEIEK